MGIPQKYMDLIGKKATFSGALFSSSKILEPTEFEILNVRWGFSTIMNLKTMEEKHPTIQYLVKREGMRASRWTRSFPVREIDLRTTKN
jgi:hypothetical protein